MLQPVPTSDLARSYNMDNVTFIEVETLEGITEHAVIDHGNGEFTSMPKTAYDAQQEAINE